MKKVLIGLLVLVVVIFIGIGLFIGPIIKAGIETLGPKITQVPIQLKGVDVSILTGSAAIKGLVVGNPQGYATPEAIKLGRAEVKLDPMSVMSPKVVIRSIRVESPEITYDGGLKASNISKILDNVNAVAKQGGTPEEQAATPSKEQSSSSAAQKVEKPAPKIQVDDFLISGAKVHVNISGLMSKELTVTLPDIHLKDMGKDSNGITPTELVRVILTQVNVSTIKAVTEAVTSSGQALEDLGKDIAKNPEKKVKELINGVGGLFKK